MALLPVLPGLACHSWAARVAGRKGQCMLRNLVLPFSIRYRVCGPIGLHACIHAWRCMLLNLGLNWNWA
jgi:hypothetical protein